jgi:hypothetical protein
VITTLIANLVTLFNVFKEISITSSGDGGGKGLTSLHVTPERCRSPVKGLMPRWKLSKDVPLPVMADERADAIAGHVVGTCSETNTAPSCQNMSEAVQKKSKSLTYSWPHHW